MTDYQFNPEIEAWKAIPDFPGYEISDQGRIRSFWKRVGVTGRRATEFVLSSHPVRVLKLICVKGYHRVTLYKDGKGTISHVHNLVLNVFGSPCPNGQEACHNDGNRGNNRFKNLRWDTKKKNQADRLNHGTDANGEKSVLAKLTTGQVIKIREMANKGFTYGHIASLFPISIWTVGEIVRRRTWKLI
jgi:hypothetical protein